MVLCDIPKSSVITSKSSAFPSPSRSRTLVSSGLWVTINSELKGPEHQEGYEALQQRVPIFQFSNRKRRFLRLVGKPLASHWVERLGHRFENFYILLVVPEYW